MVVITGDVNGDSDFNSADIIAIKAYIFNKAELTGAYAIAADVYNVGVISTSDYIEAKSTLVN